MWGKGGQQAKAESRSGLRKKLQEIKAGEEIALSLSSVPARVSNVRRV